MKLLLIHFYQNEKFVGQRYLLVTCTSTSILSYLCIYLGEGISDLNRIREVLSPQEILQFREALAPILDACKTLKLQGDDLVIGRVMQIVDPAPFKPPVRRTIPM